MILGNNLGYNTQLVFFTTVEEQVVDTLRYNYASNDDDDHNNNNYNYNHDSADKKP